MQIFSKANFNFIGNRNKAFVFSGILLLASIISLAVKGLNMSIDFVGGTVVQLKFDKPITDELAKIRGIVSELDFGKPEVKKIGRPDDNEIMITVKEKKSEGTYVSDRIKEALKQHYSQNPFQLRRQEKIGPKIGAELQKNAFLAVIFSLLAIVIYIGIRFHFPFGIASIVALFHDVIITLGAFSMLDVVIDIEFSIPIIAAILTIVGYSLNDTIVVFDRIRENLGGSVVKKSFEDKVNSSINQCLSRTIITSVTTFIVVVALFGAFANSGVVIRDFSLALIIGIIFGTYSSIFIASPTLVLWNKKWPIK
ncbi:MAG: protein translocase subunit SecF [Chitinivibrionales bacterium]|nr:protein translocase subunit SecF [Chitinivibrionales bacterium]